MGGLVHLHWFLVWLGGGRVSGVVKGEAEN